MKLISCIILILLLAFASTARGSVVIDPSHGWIGEFSWQGGLGPIDGIYDTGGTDGLWTITVAEDSYLSMALAKDVFGTPAGDSFAFVLDDTLYPWDLVSVNKDPAPGTDLSYFQGEAFDIFLAAGSHTLTFSVVTLAVEGATTYLDGYAFASFSATVPAPTTPLPAAFWLFGSGVLPVLLCKKKRNW